MRQAASDQTWNCLLGFPIAVILVQTVLLFTSFYYDTPKYLVMSGQEKEAIKVLQEFCKDEYVYAVLNEIKADVNAQAISRIHEKESVRTSNNQGDNGMKKQNKKAFLAAVHLVIMQQFSGINAIVVYGGYMAVETKEDYS